MRYFKHLSYTDRLKIEKMLKEKKSKSDIAKALRVHLSTIYRELERGQYEHLNSDYTTEMRYSPDIAHENYRANLDAKGADLKIGKDHELAEYIEETIIKKKYSPEAALGEIQRRGLKFATSICITTLYSYIEKGIFLKLTKKQLPRKGKKIHKYKRVQPAKAPCGESIEKRPEKINNREEFGHWEMDTVVGRKKSRKALLVLTERRTRKEIVIRLGDKTSRSVVRALNRLEKKMGAMFRRIFKSITVDNGSEFSDCEGMEESCRSTQKRTSVFYCHPYCASERGSNENQNGMLRRIFPKGTSFDKVTVKEVQQAEDWLNDYPRPMFGYKSANDMFQIALDSMAAL